MNALLRLRQLHLEWWTDHEWDQTHSRSGSATWPASGHRWQQQQQQQQHQLNRYVQQQPEFSQQSWRGSSPFAPPRPECWEDNNGFGEAWQLEPRNLGSSKSSQPGRSTSSQPATTSKAKSPAKAGPEGFSAFPKAGPEGGIICLQPLPSFNEKSPLALPPPTLPSLGNGNLQGLAPSYEEKELPAKSRPMRLSQLRQQGNNLQQKQRRENDAIDADLLSLQSPVWQQGNNLQQKQRPDKDAVDRFNRTLDEDALLEKATFADNDLQAWLQAELTPDVASSVRMFDSFGQPLSTPDDLPPAQGYSATPLLAIGDSSSSAPSDSTPGYGKISRRRADHEKDKFWSVHGLVDVHLGVPKPVPRQPPSSPPKYLLNRPHQERRLPDQSRQLKNSDEDQFAHSSRPLLPVEDWHRPYNSHSPRRHRSSNRARSPKQPRLDTQPFFQSDSHARGREPRTPSENRRSSGGSGRELSPPLEHRFSRGRQVERSPRYDDLDTRTRSRRRSPEMRRDRHRSLSKGRHEVSHRSQRRESPRRASTLPPDSRKNSGTGGRAGAIMGGSEKKNTAREAAKKFVHKDAALRYDPASNPDALNDHRQKLQEVYVDDLRQSHDKVNDSFANGPHKGQKVEDLIDQLKRGTVKPADLTPLVAIRFDDGKMVVVFGNRRLTALKKLQESRPRSSVKVQCIVWDYDESPGPLAAKLILSSTSSNDGRSAEIRPSSKGPKGRGKGRRKN